MADVIAPRQKTSSDADDAFLDATARHELWKQEFLQNYYKPEVDTAKKLFWGAQPEPVRQQLRTMQPQATKELDDLTIGKEGQNGK